MSQQSSAPAAPEPAPAKILTRPVLAWSLWDWGSAAFNAVVTTFVFTVYLTSDAFGPGADSKLGVALAIGGVLIALFAPVVGQSADRNGRRNLWLGVNTMAVTVICASLALVRPDPDHLWLGLVLLATGNVFFEFASVNYYAMINDLSTPRNIGRISGLGWGLGYIGGIVLLLIVYFGLINPEVGIFGITSADGMDVRVTMLLCAVWTLIFSIPVLVSQRGRSPAASGGERVGFIDSYRRLFASIARLWREDQHTVFFLLASAIFRDGLAGVFTFGGVIALGTFGFTSGQVIEFAIAANVVAGIATIAAGSLDDRFGPKRLIVTTLTLMVVLGLLIFALHDRGQWVYWSFGLLLATCVGPVQSASRTFLARLIPAGKEGEIFGLYATTGRAVSFLAPAFFAIGISLGAQLTSAPAEESTQHWGILGITLVLLIGLLLLLPVKSRTRRDSALVIR